METNTIKKTPNRLYCPACHAQTRSHKPFCGNCGKPMDPNDPVHANPPVPSTPAPDSPEPKPVPEPEPVPEPNKGGNFMKSSKFAWAIAIALLLVVAILITYLVMDSRQQAYNDKIASAAGWDSPTDWNSTSDADKTMALNEKTSLDSLETPLWDDYHKSGVLVTESGDVRYVQSGKEGTRRLQGTVKKDQILVLDCYTLVKDGEKWDGGNLLMLRGPIDLDNYEIIYTDGAAQLVDPDHAQELLDYNIAVKFARGDWDPQKNQFSYKRWALTNLWTLDYDYHTLVGKLNAANDTYPK